MVKYKFEFFDKVGHQISEPFFIDNDFSITDTDKVILHSKANGDEYFRVVLKNENENETVLEFHDINQDVSFKLYYSDGSIEHLISKVSYCNHNKTQRFYDCIAKIKNWTPSGFVNQSIRQGGENNLDARLKREIENKTDILEIKYSIPSQSEIEINFYP